VAVYFLDSSAIVKQFVSEIGSAWVTGLLDPSAGHRINLASLTGIEVVAALTRRGRGGGLALASAAVGRFRSDFTHRYRVLELTGARVAHALTLAEVHALRGSDAVQLATALQVHTECLNLGLSLTLISADAELNTAATAEGLLVEDPNAHP
jgi:predicted nucleic acid-binding protein